VSCCHLLLLAPLFRRQRAGNSLRAIHPVSVGSGSVRAGPTAGLCGAAVASTGTGRWGRAAGAGRPALLSLGVAAPRLRGRAVCGAGGTRGGAGIRSMYGGRAFLLPFRPRPRAGAGRGCVGRVRVVVIAHARFRRADSGLTAEGAFPPGFPRAPVRQDPRRKGRIAESTG